MKKAGVAGIAAVLMVLGGCALPMGLDARAAPITGEDLESLIPAPAMGNIPAIAKPTQPESQAPPTPIGGKGGRMGGVPGRMYMEFPAVVDPRSGAAEADSTCT